MGFISGLFSGSKGANYQAIGANEGQANTSYDQTQDAIAKQKAFVDATSAANGLGNQSQVYNQLQGIVDGTGPNPAAAQLANATGANVANQAALMAGQRGAGANAGLIAREAAQQGGALQQQAVGQGAALQANQSMNAINSAGNIAGQQVGQQAQALQGLNGAAQGQQANVLGSINNQNNANSQIAAQNAKGQGNLVSGITSGIGSILGLAKGGQVPLKMATGGAAPMVAATPQMVPMMPQTAVAPQPVMMAPAAPAVARPLSLAGAQMAPGAPDASMGGNLIGKGLGAGIKALGGALGIGGASAAPASNEFVGADGSGGFNPYANADGVGGGFARGGNVGGKMKQGGKVPGKPQVAGAKDSYANDTVAAKLSPGEIVLPRSVTQSSDPVRNAAAFVQAVMAKQGRR